MLEVEVVKKQNDFSKIFNKNFRVDPCYDEFNTQIFFGDEFVICEDFRKILINSKKNIPCCRSVDFGFKDFKKNPNEKIIINPINFEDLWVIYNLTSKYLNGEKVKLKVKDKLSNVFPVKNGASFFFLLVVYLSEEKKWGLGLYKDKAEMEKQLGNNFRIFSKIE